VAPGDQIAMPAQDRIGARQQPQPAKYVGREAVQQRGEEGPVARVEPNLLGAQMTFEHHHLMSQGKDLRVLGPVGHRQQAQQRERVRHPKVSQTEQHGRPSSRSDHQRCPRPKNIDFCKILLCAQKRLLPGRI
jgi:hypothetical protein